MGDFYGNFPPDKPTVRSKNSWQTSPPLQSSDTADTRKGPVLVGLRYDPSQGSPFANWQPALSAPSEDGSLSLNDAYLEYLKRLNGG